MIMHRTRLFSLCLLLSAPHLGAQSIPSDTAVKKGPLFNETTAWIAGGTVVGAAALMFADPGITEEFRDPGPQRSHLLQNAARGFNWVGDPGTVILAAALYGFVCRGRLSCYLQGIDPAASYCSPGVALLRRVIEHAIAEGVREMELLRGAEPYKYRWGARDRTQFALHVGDADANSRGDAGR